jgi:galactokinase
MKAVAAAFGKEVLRGLTEEDILAKAPELRSKVGDRAILRSLHFIRENARVEKAKAALISSDVEGFLDLVLESGRSSFQYLQNVYTTKNVAEQGLSLALCVTEGLLEGKGCAHRAHGGGFAGTIQVFVKNEYAEEYCRAIDAVLGRGSAMKLKIRPKGAVKLF